MATAATVGKIDHFNYVTTLVITPLFLVAGTFFPINQLPEWAQVAAWLNPLYHLVELVRGAASGSSRWSWIHYGSSSRLPSRCGGWGVDRMEKRLID